MRYSHAHSAYMRRQEREIADRRAKVMHVVVDGLSVPRGVDHTDPATGRRVPKLLAGERAVHHIDGTTHIVKETNT